MECFPLGRVGGEVLDWTIVVEIKHMVFLQASFVHVYMMYNHISARSGSSLKPRITAGDDRDVGPAPVG
jgi:hypothetical protein